MTPKVQFHPVPRSRFLMLAELVTAIVQYFMEKQTGIQPVLNERGLYNLYMPRFYNIMGYVCLAIGSTFPFAMVTVNSSDTAFILLFLICFLLFFSLGLLSILFYKNHKVNFDKTYIEVTNFMGKTKTTKWADLSAAKFNINSSMLTLKDHTGQKLGVQQHLVGLAHFLQLLESKKGWSAADLKIPVKQIQL